DRAAHSGELVAHEPGTIRMEHRSMPLDFIAHTADNRVLMALAAPTGVEERAEPGRRGEGAIEHRATAVELGALGGGQARQRITGLGPLACRSGSERQRYDEGVTSHGVESTPVVMRPRRSIA